MGRQPDRVELALLLFDTASDAGAAMAILEPETDAAGAVVDVTVHWANNGFLAVIGRTRDEVVVGRPVRGQVPLTESFLRAATAVLATGRTERVVEPYDIDAATRTWVSYELMRYQGYLVVRGFDITGVREVEMLLRTVTEAIDEAIGLIDHAGTIRFVNATYARMVGWSVAEMVGRAALDFVHPDDHALVIDGRRRALAGTADVSLPTVRRVRRDGSIVWTRQTFRPVSVDGVAHLLLVISDLTERRAAQRALELTEERYRDLLEVAHEGVLHVDVAGLITYANGRLYELVGRPPGSLVGQPVEVLDGGSARAGRRESVASVFTGHEPEARHEVLLRRMDGSAVWTLASASAMADADGCPDGWLALFADATDHHATELGRRTLVLAVEEERRRLAEGLHDGPVQQLAASVLRLGTVRARVPAELKPAVDTIEATLQRAIRDLRSMIFELTPPDLLGKGLAAAVRRVAALAFADTAVVVSVHDDVQREPEPAAAVAAFRIVREALGNARLHASATRVDVTIVSNDGALRVAVCDDGTGIAGDALEARAGHLGIASMRARCAEFGGRFEIGPLSADADSISRAEGGADPGSSGAARGYRRGTQVVAVLPRLPDED